MHIFQIEYTILLQKPCMDAAYGHILYRQIDAALLLPEQERKPADLICFFLPLSPTEQFIRPVPYLAADINRPAIIFFLLILFLLILFRFTHVIYGGSSVIYVRSSSTPSSLTVIRYCPEIIFLLHDFIG